MHGLKSKLIYSPTVLKKEITQEGYQATKHPTQCTRTIKNENMKRKTSPRNSNKRGFLVIPLALNKHYRDPRRLIKHQIPPNKHQTRKNRKAN
jgi:hypothetical protein